MSRALITLHEQGDRERATKWIAVAPPETRIEFKAPKRTLPQNDRFWAMLTDVATQVVWYGLKLSTGDWKLIFLNALKRESRIVPNIDGNGIVNLGASSSDLSKSEMADLMIINEMFGAERGVVFRDPREQESPSTAPADEREDAPA